jgi:hypothetical protein
MLHLWAGLPAMLHLSAGLPAMLHLSAGLPAMLHLWAGLLARHASSLGGPAVFVAGRFALCYVQRENPTADKPNAHLLILS